MSDTTELIRRLRLMSPDLIGGDAADALEQQAAEIAQLNLAEEGAKTAFGHVVQGMEDLAAECKHTLRNLHSAHDIIRRNAKKISALRSLLSDVRSALDYHQEQTRPIHSTRTALAAIDAALRQEQQAGEQSHG